MSRGHCHDWFRKWKREHNFCGLRPQDAKEMDQYINLTEKIANNGAGLDEDFIHDHFTAGAARPLLRCKDEKAYEKALNYVVACLKREEMITGGDLKATIDGFSGKALQKCPESTHLRTETVPDPAPQTLADRVREDERKAADANQAHVNPGAICTVNPIVINDSKRQSAFRTGSQVRDGIAGEMYPEKPADPPEWTHAVCKSGKCPNGDSYYAPKRGECALCGDPVDKITLCPLLERQKQPAPSRATTDPQTLTIHCTDKQWAVLKQVQREGQADSFEDAVLWLIDEAGDRMERE